MTERLEIVTCSYGPDRHRCERLCQSVDRFVPADIRHTLIVPARDVDAFRALENHRRQVLAVQDVVAGGFRQMPIKDRYWLDGRGWPVRGWIMQQVTKLSANFATDAELILFADSDLLFVRDFDRSEIERQGRLRLHRVPGAMSQGVHRKWHDRAASLLGLTPRYFGSDYVGQLICWRRSNLEALQQRIELVQGVPWYVPVARSLRISEYILYGAFVEPVLGESANGHFYSDQDLCHCCWFAEEAGDLRNGTQPISSNALALLVQSNLGLTRAEETAVVSAARQQLAAVHAGA